MNTTFSHAEFAPGSRVIVISDMHGHADLLRRLLAKIAYRAGEDYLILAGDLVEKGTDSLGVVREAMHLAAQSERVTVMMGNNDLWRFEQLAEPTPERDQILFHTTASFTAQWGSSLFGEMCRELGVTYASLTDLPAAREAVSRAFSAEIAFLASLPTILLTPQYLFVHGGIPCAEADLDTLTARNAFDCLKYDRFCNDLGLRHAARFSRPVIVGHWPVTLYRPTISDCNPFIDDVHNVISIDGGCGLNQSGQLNALILTPDNGHFTWVSLDDLPIVRAHDAQSASDTSISLKWGDHAVRRLPNASRPGYALVEHIRTGRRLHVPADSLYTEDDQLYCLDMTDYTLPVRAGDILSVVKVMPDAILAKKDGIVGWYAGKYTALVDAAV